MEQRNTTDRIERRYHELAGLEVRAGEPNDDGSIPMEGYASVFGATADILGLWTEEVKPGAFRKTARDGDVRLLINHNPDLVLARSKLANRQPSLRLSEDGVGLRVDADMAPTTYAQDLAISMDRGEINQMSIGFRVVKEEWDWDIDPPHRSILEMSLRDASIVTFPAFVETEASLRSLSGDPEEIRSEIERLTQLLTRDDLNAAQGTSLRAAMHALEARIASLPEPPCTHSDIERRRRVSNRRLYEIEQEKFYAVS